MPKHLALLSAFAVVLSSPVVSASAADRAGAVVRLGAGLAGVTVDVGDERRTETGPMGDFQLGFTARPEMQLLVQLHVQPFRVENPLRAEAFRAAYVLPSLQAYRGNAYLRAGVGICRFSYSGADVFVASETSIAYGLAAGYEKPSKKLRPSIEAFGRWSHSPDGELRTRAIGLQLSGTWYSK